jgi:hypothetical protein
LEEGPHSLISGPSDFNDCRDRQCTHECSDHREPVETRCIRYRYRDRGEMKPLPGDLAPSRETDISSRPSTARPPFVRSALSAPVRRGDYHVYNARYMARLRSTIRT